MADTPNPGSPDAVSRDCTCPVIDNARGRGWMGGAQDRDGNVMFVFNAGCPMHGGKND